MGTGPQEGASGGFNWDSIYPNWWWSCNHPSGNDRDCIYCWRKRQSKPFGDQYDYYSNRPSRPSSRQGGVENKETVAGTAVPPVRDIHPFDDCAQQGFGQGLSYNLPARDFDHGAAAPTSYSRAHNPLRARISHPINATYQGKVNNTQKTLKFT